MKALRNDQKISTRAFISHSRKDAQLAKQITRRINTYKPPKAAELGEKKIGAFLDVEGLTVGDSLSDRLKAEVLGSDFFVLLASPDSATSVWVEEETETFIRSKGMESVLPLLVRGTPETSFPPALSSNEPLFLDLRYPHTWPLGARRLRLDILRLIAALYGVEYKQLRRENERRRKLRQVTVAASIALSLLAFLAVYLVNTVPPKAWVQIAQPDSQSGEPLKPIVDIAIDDRDPSRILWRGKNASWVEARPNDHGRLEVTLPPDVESLMVNSASGVSREEDFSGENVLVPLFELGVRFHSFGGEESLLAEVAYRIYQFQSGEKTYFYRDLKGTNHDPESGLKNHYLPPHKVWNNPFELWSTKEVESWKYPLDLASLKCVLTFPTEDRSLPIDAYWWGPEEGIPEANEIRQEYVTFGNFEPDDFFDLDEEWELVTSEPRWKTYQAPVAESFSLTLESDSDGNSNETVRDYLVAQLPGHHGLVQIVEQFDWQDGMVHTLDLIQRPGHPIALASISTHYRYDEPVPGEVPEIKNFVQMDEEPWVPLILENISGQIRPLDAMEIRNENPQKALVTESNGIFFYDDKSSKWLDGNFGNYQLPAGGKIRLIPTSGALFVHLTGAAVGEKANPLFKLTERTWWQRLAASLSLK